MGRLQWQRAHGGGFVALPDGPDFPERVARITPMRSRTGAYSWTVSFDGASIPGIADSSQEASDAANEAWERVQEKARQLARQRAEEDRLSAMVEAAVHQMDPDLTPFAIGTTGRETLTWIITRAAKKASTPGRAKLVNALSIELYKFRTGERTD